MYAFCRTSVVGGGEGFLPASHDGLALADHYASASSGRESSANFRRFAEKKFRKGFDDYRRKTYRNAGTSIGFANEIPRAPPQKFPQKIIGSFTQISYFSTTKFQCEIDTIEEISPKIIIRAEWYCKNIDNILS